MTSQEILRELRRIRSLTHSSPILATEHAIDRLVIAIQQDEDELEKEWETLTSGRTLVSGGLEIKLVYETHREN